MFILNSFKERKRMKLYFLLSMVMCGTIFSKVTFKENGYSYDDVLLVPQYSAVASRSDVSLRAKLTKKIELETPFVSSNMDSVTENDMAISIAQAGGIGIVHRFNSIQDQVLIIKKVKRYKNSIVQQPICAHHDLSLKESRKIMKKNGITSLLIIDAEKKLIGIVTQRDIPCSGSNDENKKISFFMTRFNNLITGDQETTLDEAKKILSEYKIEKLPLINSEREVVGLITKKDILNHKAYPKSSVDSRGRFLVGAAIGTKSDALERARLLLEAEVDVLVIDIAHGHSEQTVSILKILKTEFPDAQVIAGNVATAEGTRDLIEAGADAVKVGVGPGSICTTRIVTGCGYPQLSAIMECAQEADKYGVPVIADGGIKVSGDIVKAFGAGASTVMLGSLLAGTDESPGMPFLKNGKKYKVIRGMASFGANLSRNENTTDKNNIEKYVPEVVEALVSYKGDVATIIEQLVGGVKSGMSYCGVKNLKNFRGQGVFVPMTSSGLRESRVHDVSELS